ncbi:hypothetical protein AYJ57_21415 (plasmid) [Salipiger sp. CCB-MM3]|uniref:aminotransferase class I/II-fold pyridoxal phosphate-dependent enzyme n=1 Tax=Salipiger sp. CCB-MM3 TaxID=1792508 RepID=UPI00080A9ACF|nr:pyridoxal phosphate-dependent aminotransferase family protein [Salipiger sp. CCB-MM3]ANT63036.1 hypothetical protein AYJ57_21415 [Salipiger sp. CCB-MM3]
MNDPVLFGSVPDFLDYTAADAAIRFGQLTAWLDARHAQGLDPYSRSTSSRVGPQITAHGRLGRTYEGVNFASQDYLNLSTHPAVMEAAKQAIDAYGVHSAGSSALMGNTHASLELERKLADFTGFADCTLFPTGWAAGYGIIRTLVTPQDHVVIDVLAHACLHEGARAATSIVHTFPHLSNEGVERRLRKIRESDDSCSITVVTETAYSMDSDVPDLRGLQTICRQYGATLVVDCAHDLGAIGEHGGGYLELLGMTGGVDILMGSFSKTFASNGGFVATNQAELKLAIRYTCGPHTFSNAMSPVNAKIVSRCLDIIQSDEGFALRQDLLRNIRLMRTLLSNRGFTVLGRDSAIVPVILGDSATSRLITRSTLEAGGIVNLVEFPAVARNSCRWRLQMMARHTDVQIRHLVDLACDARAGLAQNPKYRAAL